MRILDYQKTFPLAIIFMFLCSLLQAQDPLPSTDESSMDSLQYVSRATAQKPLIFPGCEVYENDNRELYKCFNNKFFNLMLNNLDAFELQSGKVIVTIAFYIKTDGSLEIEKTDVRGAVSNLSYFEEKAVTAFKRSADFLHNSKLKIQPALNAKGEPANMRYTIPITFQSGR